MVNNCTRTKKNRIKLFGLLVFSIAAVLMYQFINVDTRFFNYAMHIRTPKLLSISIAAFCICSSTLVFQSIVKNNIVTPSLLGMSSLYSLIHTVMIFVLGSTSIFVLNRNIAFIIDLSIMGIVGTSIYGYLFKATKYNILYVLLSGTVIGTLFGSITGSLIRIMDPNEFSALQDRLIAGFNNTNSEIIGIAVLAILAIIAFLYKEIKLLNIITLGKNQAINLGVDYDRTITRLLLGVTLFMAISTALVGPISFLGLVTANISRQLIKTYKHSYLIAGSVLIGIIILIGGQAFIEHVLNYNTTISVCINLFGGAYFLYLIMKNRSA